MALKESSDELNPPVVTGVAVVPKSRSERSAKDYLATYRWPLGHGAHLSV